MNHLSINLRNRKNTISRNLYGQFSEHLGRGIYGGIYVGEDSDISHINGMRQDVVEALKKIKVPVNTTGRTALARVKAERKWSIPTGEAW